MTEHEQHEIDATRVTILEEEITERLLEMADTLGPEDTLAYVEKVAGQMRDEIAEGV